MDFRRLNDTPLYSLYKLHNKIKNVYITANRSTFKCCCETVSDDMEMLK